MNNTAGTFMEQSDFWKCISILLKNYHAVNKKIFACKITAVNQILDGISHIYSEIDPNYEQKSEPLEPQLKIKTSSEEEVIKTLGSCDNMNQCEGFMLSMKFLTKNDEDTIMSVAIIDFVNTQYTCTLESESFDDFRVSFRHGELVTNSLSNRRNEPEPERWIDFVLKPKLLKWSNCEEKTENAFESLRLIDVEYYNNLYKKLKEKYSKSLIDIWEECTDPLKFIYEDLAIAAYLICLWREHHCLPNAFADLGCGNGLLVYILNQEGYKGCGYDVRSRKIWSLFPKTTILFEETIVPNQFKLPSDVDWIIGNHSDELSPWIPTIAALGSNRMKYFLLPCCPFEFSGMKFQRRNSSLSSYNDFLNYVETISRKCGFLTIKDRLKIPSTKRIAIIGIARTYAETNHHMICSGIEELLAAEIQKNPLKLREKYEAVRNCTQIDSEKLNNLILKIFFYLLGTEKASGASDGWNEGVQRTIKDLAQHLNANDLKTIKSECGGIKTMLKNKHEVFEFCPGDNVKIRCPKTLDPSTIKSNHVFKKRVCFFHTHHPDGCPLTNENCTFIHNSQVAK